MYIENIVIGNPLVEPSTMFALDEEDWERLEKEKTIYTNERFLPRILVDIGIFPSINEIRRNKPHFVKELNELDFIEVQATKKRKVWVLVGE